MGVRVGGASRENGRGRGRREKRGEYAREGVMYTK